MSDALSRENLLGYAQDAIALMTAEATGGRSGWDAVRTIILAKRDGESDRDRTTRIVATIDLLANLANVFADHCAEDLGVPVEVYRQRAALAVARLAAT